MNTFGAGTFPIRTSKRQYDQRFMQMNEIRRGASDRVQRAIPNVAVMIDGTDHPDLQIIQR